MASEIFRTRDVVVFTKGKTIPVMIDSAMAAGGWPGGQGVQWIDDPNNDTFKVTYSAGRYGGFLLWGSDEKSDQYISVTQSQPTYKYGVMAIGPWVVSTSTFETYTLASRLGGPLVKNVFTPGTKLRFSLRGFFTPEKEDPNLPDLFVARVIQKPDPNINNGYLELQSAI
jgi:hypothetical protein